MSSLFPDTTGAVFSLCRKYRYSLWRIWDASKPVCMFLMLNPSTADETDNDPTVQRCQTRAVEMGYGGLRVCNIFAWRSTDRSVLAGLEDPIGPNNDDAIIKAAKQSAIVICAWGIDGSINGRGKDVLGMLREAGIQPYALIQNDDGSPGHPLYVSYNCKPFPLKG